MTDAIDSGNTGNIILFSNKRKFEEEIGEDEYNKMLVDSLNEFLSIPDKNEKNKLLDGHIDQEDFSLFLSKSYFNHFTCFDYNPQEPFEEWAKREFGDAAEGYIKVAKYKAGNDSREDLLRAANFSSMYTSGSSSKPSPSATSSL